MRVMTVSNAEYHLINIIKASAFLKGNMTEFHAIHHFKALEMLISLIYLTCDFKVVCSRYSAFNYFIKARVVLS